MGLPKICYGFLVYIEEVISFTQTTNLQHMKLPVFLLAPALLLSAVSANAQFPFLTRDSIDINKVHALTTVHGDMWFDHITSQAFCKFPYAAKTSINLASALWMSGYDASSNLHIAAQTYRQMGNDYWPGPLDGADTLTYATSSNWAKIWKVNRTDINYFRGLSAPTTTTTPAAILTWPGKGNTYAQGNAGAPLTVTTSMAPFVDLNGNGIYEPLLGEYPDVPGDQALWYVFSDNGPTHTETNGRPLGVEVHAMAYAYSRGTLIDNVVYYKYDVVNKSANNYHNFRIALWDDVDLGYAYDDMIGFDSTWRMGIAYNGTNDDGGSAGHPANSFGTSSPISAVSMMAMPGDVGSARVPVGSFVYYNNDFSGTGNPSVDTEYNNYMRSKYRDGRHVSRDFAGRGIPSMGHSGGPNCDYVYTGDPADTTQWSECNSGNLPGDRRFILSGHDFNLNAGATESITLALVTTDTGAGGNGCPNTNYNKIRLVADTAWHVYITLASKELQSMGQAKVYPNPAHDRLYLEDPTLPLSANTTINLYNTLGQLMKVKPTLIGNRYETDISLLPAGMYYLQYARPSGSATLRFIKE